MASLSSSEVRRYSRHLLLPEFGLAGQKKLKASRVLVIGAGGLGAPASMYLAAAGIGTLGIVDFDAVDLSNLQRQIIHRTQDVGRAKSESAAQKLGEINDQIIVRQHELKLTAQNAIALFEQYDLVLDGSDNYSTRYLINDAAIFSKVPVVSASVFRFEGQVSIFGAPGGPCYRCLYPEPAPAHLSPSCGEGGVLGAVTGVIGTLQATEAIKLISGIGEPLVGRLLLFDALEMRFRQLNFKRDPACAVCGMAPTVTTLIDYDVFCGITSSSDVPSMTVEQFQSRTDLQVVDVREPLERELNAIAGAKLIPLSELEARVAELDPTRDAVFVCKVGQRSASAVAKLQRLGFQKVFNLSGGLDALMETDY